MRRRGVLIGIILAAVPLAWGTSRAFRSYREAVELREARAEIDRGHLGPARQRLVRLLGARPGALGGRADYWLGICEALRGDPDAALSAFDRVPDDFRFDPKGAHLKAAACLERGRIRDAEACLEAVIDREGPSTPEVRDLLIRVEQVQVRFEDAGALLRDGLGTSEDPIAALKLLGDLGRGGLPVDGLRDALDEAGQMAPEDDRVWLGKGRLAILTGHWDVAAGWLRRCLEARPDPPVWEAWLDYARGAGLPEQAIRALEHLGPEDLGPADRLSAHAWIAGRRGDIESEHSALTRLLAIDPGASDAMERLAALALGRGETDRAIDLRERKAAFDHALDRYRRRLLDAESLRSASDRVAMAGLAERLGLLAEAGAWFKLARESAPEDPEIPEAIDRLDRAVAERRTLAIRARAATIESVGEAPAETVPGPESPIEVPRFVDRGLESGLRFTYDNGATPFHQLPEPLGGGVALLDFDLDGWLDVYAVQGGPFPPRDDRRSGGDRLFRNLGDGTFEDVTEASGIAGFEQGYGFGVASGDIDNDGDPDLFVTRWRSYALYRNRGDGTFEDITEAMGLGGDRDWPTSVAFADLDNDGDLDLFVCHYAEWDAQDPRLCRDASTHAYVSCNPLECRARPDHLFRNVGGRFEDVTEEAGIVDLDGRGLGVVAADLDEDGLVDLYVANDMTANACWRNLGGLRFEEVAARAGLAGNADGGYQAGMGVAAGDLDGDGRIDLLVTNFYGESTTFYKNLGAGLFLDQTGAIGLATASRHLLGFGVVLFDANNDARLDLATANGHINDHRPNFPFAMPAQLMLGMPGGRLDDVSERAGDPWSTPRIGRGLASGDLDNDGRVDLVFQGHGQPLADLRNISDGGHFLVLELEGTASQRDAIGAVVDLRIGDRHLSAQRTGGGSYQSSSSPRLHFGLGDATAIDDVQVTWPSGQVDHYRDLLPDAGYCLREGDPMPVGLIGY